ncbi:Nucleolar protein 10, partial [Irineochytrium annulatum]
MSMQVTYQNNVKIYSITSAARSAIPDWLAKRKAKSLKYDAEYRSRIELIQDFQFPEASLKIKYTPDNKYIVATGLYKPQIRVYDLAELAMKLDRTVDYENIDFCILSEDWTKTVYLNVDRSIEFHSQFGMHYRTRIPKYGRALAYDPPSCDLLVVGSSNEAYRLNLDQGKFLTPLVTESNAINSVAVNPAHGVLAFGGEDGHLELWHPTQRNRLARLDVATWMGTLGANQVGALDDIPAITKVAFHDDGLTTAVGTSTGHVLLYDLRSPYPLLCKDHQYGMPIKSIIMNHPTGNICSADSKVVRFWSKEDGKLFTAIEPPTDINDVCVGDGSGLVMIANEGTDIQTYFVPELGPAPRWCPFLDNLTEELEENAAQMTIYDDYKFVTRKELTRLGLDHLIGTAVLKAYMHGFFVDLRLYQKAKAIADPFEYDEHRKRMIAKKIEKQRGPRIHAERKLPKVNRDFAIKIMKAQGELEEDEDVDESGRVVRRGGSDEEMEEDDDERAAVRGKAAMSSKKKKKGLTLKKDDRFGAMFEDEDFKIDESTEEFRLRFPLLAKGKINKAPAVLQNFEKVDADDAPIHGRDDDEDDDDNNKSGGGGGASKLKKPASGPSMYAIRDGVTGAARRDPFFTRHTNAASTTFGDRLKAGDAESRERDRVVQFPGGNKSITFTPGRR